MHLQEFLGIARSLKQAKKVKCASNPFCNPSSRNFKLETLRELEHIEPPARVHRHQHTHREIGTGKIVLCVLDLLQCGPGSVLSGSWLAGWLAGLVFLPVADCTCGLSASSSTTRPCFRESPYRVPFKLEGKGCQCWLAGRIRRNYTRPIWQVWLVRRFECGEWHAEEGNLLEKENKALEFRASQRFDHIHNDFCDFSTKIQKKHNN